jgi:hypothetical protein
MDGAAFCGCVACAPWTGPLSSRDELLHHCINYTHFMSLQCRRQRLQFNPADSLPWRLCFHGIARVHATCPQPLRDDLGHRTASIVCCSCGAYRPLACIVRPPRALLWRNCCWRCMLHLSSNRISMGLTRSLADRSAVIVAYRYLEHARSLVDCPTRLLSCGVDETYG